MAKKKSLFISILRIITMLMLVMFVAVVILCLVEGDTSIIPSGVILVLLCFFLWWYLGKLQTKRVNSSKAETEIAESKEEFEIEEQFSDEELAKVPEGFNKIAYLKLDRMIVTNPGIQMNNNETCFYVGPAKGFKDKEKVVGYTGGGAGVSFRIAKGVSVHTGSSAKKAIRQNVRDYSDGTLYLTNMRVLLLAPKYGFSVTILKLAQVEHSDITKTLHFYTQGGKAYSVKPDEFPKVMKVLQLMSELKKIDDNQV